ncbi:MAG: hypothetical protein DCC68_19325 [Planctomycetota bacterium]|nr:MAG: hypothetical protein DCC68_19325 [Planctomycetota bacterium]
MLDELNFISQILAALGVTAAVLSGIRRALERRRWEAFRCTVNEWTDDMLAVGIRIDKRLTEEEWQSECEAMLTNVGFTPIEVTAMLPVSIVVAKGVSSTKFLA